MKKKRNLYIIAFLLFISLVGVTIAYLQSTSVLENIFEAGVYKTVTHEEFTSPSNWTPGDITTKTITTKNEGTIPVRVRVKLEESWTSENDNELSLTFTKGNDVLDVAVINYGDLSNWIYQDGYFYYDEELEPGDETSTLIESVMFNIDTPNSITCVKSQDGLTEECSYSGDGFEGGTYKLSITTETVQSNAYQAVWNIDSIREKYAMFDKGSIVNKKIKEISSGFVENMDYTTVNSNIISFIKSDVEPDQSIENDNYVVSSKISNYPIYSWYDNGNIYWWSESEEISFNDDNSYYFAYLTGLEDISGIEGIDTSNVTSFQGFFKGDTSMSDFSLVSDFDTSNAVDLSSMFEGCIGLTTTDLFEEWDVSNVETFARMFYHNINLTTLRGLIDWETTSATSIRTMFYENVSLTSLYGVDNFDTSNVTDMSFTFSGQLAFPMHYTSLEPVRNWDVRNVELLDFTFQINYEITDISPLIDWTFNNLKSLKGTFFGSIKLTSLNGLQNWDTSKVTNMYNLFHACHSLMDASAIEEWDVSKVTDMSYMFNISNGFPTTLNYSLLPELDLSKWNMSKVKDYTFFMEDLRAVKAEMTISSTNIRRYTGAFGSAACTSDSYIILNYVAETESIVDSLVATKTNGCHVSKGVLKTN